MIWPELAEETLTAVLTDDQHTGLRIGGQYWDAIIWAQAAWHHYLTTGNKTFLHQAFITIQNSLRYAEAREFDAADGLFRGGGCFFDGIAAYPDTYTDNGPGGSWATGLVGWSERHSDLRHPNGDGFPGKTLSTNCLYARAYELLPVMAALLDIDIDSSWSDKFRRLCAAIHASFGDGSSGRLAYFRDQDGLDDKQEGLGYAFAVLFNIVDPAAQQQLVKTAHRTDHGMPSLYPDYPRYTNLGPGKYGRHGSTVWPHVNAMWASACAQTGDRRSAFAELNLLTDKVCRDGHFAEIYHPDTGQRYGGEQEATSIKNYKTWDSECRQTWCATGYIRMILDVIFGVNYGNSTLSGTGWLPDQWESCTLSGIQWHGQRKTLSLTKKDGLRILDG